MEYNKEEITKKFMDAFEDARKNGSAKVYINGNEGPTVATTPINEHPIQDSKPIMEPEKPNVDDLTAYVRPLFQILNSPDNPSIGVGQNAHDKSVSPTPVEIELNNSNVKDVVDFNFRLLWERIKKIIIPILIAAGIFQFTLAGLGQYLSHNNRYEKNEENYEQQAYFESIDEQSRSRS